MAPAAPKRVAGVVTVYRRNSHADVILGKVLEGYLHDGGDKPNLQLVSLYVDQFPDKDLSRDLAKQYGFKIFDRIADALTLGTKTLAVDGVVIVGEHGDYPDNDRGQKLYPRRRFFEHVAATFEAAGTSVPVFTDKHLSARWDDARWVYDKARALYAPLLAGSSIPVTWRKPNLVLPQGCEVAKALALGYGPEEGYGFHALEGLQCMVERRKGGETGVAAVRFVPAAELWEVLDAGGFTGGLLDEAVSHAPAPAKGDMRELTAKSKKACAFVVEYRDGLTAAVAMLNGFLLDGSFCFAGQLRGEDKPRGCRFHIQDESPFAHFAALVKAIESLVHTGHAPYPVERTLLTTGILDAAMTSRHLGGKRVETPHLKIAYKPTEWPPYDAPVPPTKKRP